mgnify:CR=1 FL=1
MKNILLLSHIYPGAGVPESFTPVVHYFAREWQKLGYNVRVISIWNYFPFFYYWVPKWLRNYMVSKYGCALPERQLRKGADYTLDNVNVTRLTILKWKPGSVASEEKLKKMSDNIVQILSDEQFKPEYIISHWAVPQIYLSKCLKNVYHVPAALILHEDGKRIKKFPNWRELIDSIDVFGYRSKNIKSEFEQLFGVPKHSFHCYSGIPSSYLENIPNRDFSYINRFIYIGYLMPRKYPDVIIEAVNNVYKEVDYEINIIGDGELRRQLETMVTQSHLQDKVHLQGRLKREDSIPLLDKSDVFIMVSKNEVFGLVYIEAMARGCIVVASKGEGMQGIIIDGENGFLCEAGNKVELERVLQKINNMPEELLQRISRNAINTAMSLSDKEVAKSYLENIFTMTNE